MARGGVLGRLRSFVTQGDPEVVYECRRCGKTLDTDAGSCPECEAEAIERFVI